MPSFRRSFVHFFIRSCSRFTTMARSGCLVLVVVLLLLGCSQRRAQPSPAVTVPAMDEVTAWAISGIVGSLPNRALAGQLLMAGIENAADGSPLLALDAQTSRIISEVQPGAAVLFGRTFAGVDQVLALIGAVHELVLIAPIIATDYEGGLVSRLTTTGGIPATRIPSAAVVGRAVRTVIGESEAHAFDLARELGRVMGRELRALGVTMNFAPVVDVDPTGGIGSIGRHGRAFGDDPVLVGRIAAAVSAGLQEEGVASVIKHFPGHGDVADDSHDGFAVLEASRETIERRELVAFRVAMEAAPLGVMTGHLSVPALTGSDEPASLSAAVTSLIRGSLGYPGLIVTDALNMRAMTAIAPEQELVIRALEGGADMILKPLDLVNARDAIVRAVDEGRLEREKLTASVERVFHVKRTLGILGPDWVVPRGDVGSADLAAGLLGSAGHVEVVNRILSLSGGRD